MQLRHLRYFVKIVDAGSISRAAATIHVAQPALSQQIAELEEKLGIELLQRSARGVRPTKAGEALYREAISILKQVENLPSIIRSSGGQIEGVVSVGMSSTLATLFASPLIEASRQALPNVTLRLSVADSQSVKMKVQANTLDMAVVFEDEHVPIFARKPLFRQRLYLVSRKPLSKMAATISFAELGKLPLILPSLENVTRMVLDRAFGDAGISPNIVTEADVWSSVLAAVRTGIGHTVLPAGNLSDLGEKGLAPPLLIEPPLLLTASIISSSDFPLTLAGDAVRSLLVDLTKSHLEESRKPGVEWIG